MNYTLATLLLISGFAAVIASIPQLIQLIRIKESDEFNLTTYFIWITYQLISIFYTASIHAYVYTAINILWVLYYIVIIALIVKYRKKIVPVHETIE